MLKIFLILLSILLVMNQGCEYSVQQKCIKYKLNLKKEVICN